MGPRGLNAESDGVAAYKDEKTESDLGLGSPFHCNLAKARRFGEKMCISFLM